MNTKDFSRGIFSQTKTRANEQKQKHESHKMLLSKCQNVSLLGNHCMCEDYSCANEGTCSVIISSSISTTPMFCLDFTLLGTAALLNLLDSTLVSI